MAYEWTHTKALRRHGHGGTEFVEQGEKFDPTDEELAAFADRIAEVEPPEEDDAESSEPAAEAADDGESAQEGTDPPFDPGDYTVTELEDVFDEESFSADELDALAAAEQADGNPRATALDAIDAARQ